MEHLQEVFCENSWRLKAVNYFRKKASSYIGLTPPLSPPFLKGGVNFQGLSFLHLEITLTFAKLYYAFEEKIFKKIGHSKLSKNEPENIPLIKITYL